jgi:tetratricopeptide (TPR) repeat protein
MGDREKTPDAVRKEVLAQLDEILIDQPGCYAARFLRSELSVLWGQTQRGLEDLETLEKLYGDTAPLKALEGVAWYRSGDKEKADRAFRAALKRDRRNVRSLLYSGIILAEDGQLDEAGKYFRRVLKIDPENATALKYQRTVRAQESREAGRELVGATDPGHLKESGLLLLKAGKMKQAVPILLEALRSSPRDRELLTAASRAFARLERYLKAAELLHHLIGNNGQDTEAWHLLGVVYARAGENDRPYLHHALHCYQQAVSLDPERFDALHAAAEARRPDGPF